jgi:hypothetical protein
VIWLPCRAGPERHRERRGQTITNGEPAMPLVNIVVILIVVGVLLWLVNNYIPMDGKIKSILNVVVVVVVVIWLLQIFGIIGSIGAIRVR